MSKKNKTTFKYKAHYPLPKLKKIKTEWDLKKHFYSGEHDPNIERDLRQAERAYTGFAKKYRGKNFTKNAPALLSALRDYEKLVTNERGSKAAYYFHYRQCLNAKDPHAEKKLNLIEERLTKAQNHILFFTLALGKIPKRRQKELLEDMRLSYYRYYLERVFLEAAHTLTEPEERIVSLLSGPSYGMWTQMTEKIISNRMVTFSKKKFSLPEALEHMEEEKGTRKEKLWNSILEEVENIAEVAESELTAIVTRQKIGDDLRGYRKPYSATVQSYENDEKSVEALVEAVRTRGYALSRAFFKMKAAYLGRKTIPYVHRNDPIGPQYTVPFKQAVEICRDTFYSTKKEYGVFFDRMLGEGTIDVFPRTGKRGGGFMSSNTNQPIFVFLNHTSTFNSLETLAHEMGHALHTERSRQQGKFYEDYTMCAAEIASTLFENLAFDRLIESATSAQKRELLHDRIVRTIATIQRQIAFFNFELEMHKRIRAEGALSKEELAKMMVAHTRDCFGPAVSVSEKDGYLYVYVGHFRAMFYVYTYAYGLLVSNILRQNLNSDPSYISQIDTFLSSGGSNTVEEILRGIGINTYTVETFNTSIASLEKDIKAFEKLTQSR